MIFDTHAHYYDERFDADRKEVLSSLEASNVGLVVNVSSDLDSSRASVGLSEEYPFIYAAVGVHPHNAEGAPGTYLDELGGLAARERVVAIGEIGLDYHYDLSPRPVQKQRFREQLELASALKLPVIIHDRQAHEDTLDIIKDYPPVYGGVFHCYSGSLEMAKLLIKKGWHVSFTGNVTFSNAKKLWETAAWVPDEALMIETDCPYMAPEPLRGTRNDSRNLTHLIGKLAELRNTTAEHIEAVTWDNGRKFFGV